MNLTILGIRHHGVGSARYVADALAQLQPDLVLVEGAPELDAVLSFISRADLEPPVAVLGYNPNSPKQAVFYPFAEFSPEWQALRWAAQSGVPARMIDLPLSHSFGLSNARQAAETAVPNAESPPSPAPDAGPLTAESANADPHDDEMLPDDAAEPLPPGMAPRGDSLLPLAMADGYTDSETWWEQHVEQRYGAGQWADHFAAVQEAMTALREQDPPDAETDLREAFMRHLIRQADADGFQQVVVVCGAWHGPALTGWETTKKTDTKQINGLPKTPVSVTWIPWTYERLGWRSGYGAGITSPGWYDHNWHHPDDTGIRWLTHVARLFRQNKMDTSTAHVIEAYRLAESLAGLRGWPRPGLAELNEATQSVLCFGDGILLRLVEAELIVGKRMGRVPDDTPKLPLQADFDALIRQLRLPLTGERKPLDLDLRKALDLNRSRFLHRLLVLDMTWGQRAGVRTKGTFKEGWLLRWEPDMVLQVVGKAIYGNRVEDAATAFLLEKSRDSTRIGELAGLVQQAIPAELFGAIGPLLMRVGELATLAADVLDLMQAFTPLVEISRYGNVRNTDLTVINQLVNGLITRVCIGLPNACYGLDATSAATMLDQIRLVNEATRLLAADAPADGLSGNRSSDTSLPTDGSSADPGTATLRADWLDTLRTLLTKAEALRPDGNLPGVHPLIAGGTCRLLFDGDVLTGDDTARAFGLALSTGHDPAYSAALARRVPDRQRPDSALRPYALEPALYLGGRPARRTLCRLVADSAPDLCPFRPRRPATVGPQSEAGSHGQHRAGSRYRHRDHPNRPGRIRAAGGA